MIKRNITLWLLPLFTILTIVSALFLPQRLSLMQDETLLNTVHSEKLTSYNDLPVNSLDLPQRISLLAQWQTFPENLISVNQSITDPSEYQAMNNAVNTVLNKLAELHIFPEEMISAFSGNRTGNRLTLRSFSNSTGATYYRVMIHEESYGDKYYLYLIIDEESGLPLWLELIPSFSAKIQSAPETATIFLEYLGIDYELVYGTLNDALCSLTSDNIAYHCIKDYSFLQLIPQYYEYSDTDAKSTYDAY